MSRCTMNCDLAGTGMDNPWVYGLVSGPAGSSEFHGACKKARAKEGCSEQGPHRKACIIREIPKSHSKWPGSLTCRP